MFQSGISEFKSEFYFSDGGKYMATPSTKKCFALPTTRVDYFTKIPNGRLTKAFMTSSIK